MQYAGITFFWHQLHLVCLFNGKFCLDETLSVIMNGLNDHQLQACIFSIVPKECSPPEAAKVWHTFWEGYLAIIIGVFGVAGNTLSIAVLLDGLLLDLFDRMLLCLAICDITFLGKTKNKFQYYHIGKSFLFPLMSKIYAKWNIFLF